MIRSDLEATLALHLQAADIPFEREYKAFEKMGRKFRWDFFIHPDLLIEVQGATWARGAHSRGAGLHRDYVKANLATLHKYRTLFFDKELIESGAALKTIEEAMRA